VEAARFREPARDPLLGTVFQDRYEIVDVLGRGGMGAVYKATQMAVGRPVALKVLNPNLADDLRHIARFQQEARTIAAIQHPNIVGMIDFGVCADSRLFLVMEYLEGEPLSAVMVRDGPMPAERVVRLALQVLDALTMAHDHDIIHRDLKPANIFVTRLGRKTDVAKVLDFGIAKVSGEIQADMSLTATGQIIGSPRYMSPEQARNRPVSPATDLYAVGVIMYEMLTGSLPFTGNTPTEFAVAHITRPPLVPTLGGRRLQGPLVDLVMQCLAKSPDERPASAEALAVRLRLLEQAGSPWVGLGEATGPGPALEETPGVLAPAVGPAHLKRDPTPAGRVDLSLQHRRSDHLPDLETGSLSGSQVARRQGKAGARSATVWSVAATLLLAAGGLGGWLVYDRLNEIAPEGLPIAPGGSAPPSPRGQPPEADPVPAPAPAPASPAAPVPASPAAPVPAVPGPEAKRMLPAPPKPALPVRLVSEPPGAEARIGDTVLGTTPLPILWGAGEAAPTVLLTKPGYVALAVVLGEGSRGGEQRVSLVPSATLEESKAPEPAPVEPAAKEVVPKKDKPPKKKRNSGDDSGYETL
jgi:serine/threonine-protein kinase